MWGLGVIIICNFGAERSQYVGRYYWRPHKENIKHCRHPTVLPTTGSIV
jgi:hypothetical protein